MNNTDDIDQSIPLDDLYSVEDFAARHSNVLTVQALRWQLRSREQNGLAQCCVTLGRKLLISKSRYERWLATQAGVAA